MPSFRRPEKIAGSLVSIRRLAQDYKLSSPFYQLGCTDESLEAEAKLFGPVLRRESVSKSPRATTPGDISDRTHRSACLRG